MTPSCNHSSKIQYILCAINDTNWQKLHLTCRFDCHYRDIFADPVSYMLDPYTVIHILWGRHLKLKSLIICCQISSSVSFSKTEQSFHSDAICQTNKASEITNRLTTPELERAGVAVHREVHQTHRALCVYRQSERVQSGIWHLIGLLGLLRMQSWQKNHILQQRNL